MAAFAAPSIDPIKKLAILDNLHDFHTCKEGLGKQLEKNLEDIFKQYEKKQKINGGWEGDYVEAILHNAIINRKITQGNCVIHKNIKRSNVDKEKKQEGICNPYYETTIDVKKKFDDFFEINNNTPFTTCHDASYGANNFEKKWGEYNRHTLLKIPQNTWDSALAVKSSCMTNSKFKVYFPSDDNDNKIYTFTSNKLTEDSNFTISFKKKNTIFSRLNNASNSVNLLDKYSGEKIKLKITYSNNSNDDKTIEFKSLGKIKYIVKNIKKVITSIKKKITRKKKQPKPKEKEINETGVTRNELCIISGGTIGEQKKTKEKKEKKIKPNTLAFKLEQILEQIEKKVTRTDYNNLLMDIKRTGDWEQVLGTKKYQQENPTEKVIFFTGDALCFLYAVYNNINCALFVRTKLIMYKTSGNLNSVNSKLLNEYFTSETINETINAIKERLNPKKQSGGVKRTGRTTGRTKKIIKGKNKIGKRSKTLKQKLIEKGKIKEIEDYYDYLLEEDIQLFYLLEEDIQLLNDLMKTYLIRVIFDIKFKNVMNEITDNSIIEYYRDYYEDSDDDYCTNELNGMLRKLNSLGITLNNDNLEIFNLLYGKNINDNQFESDILNKLLTDEEKREYYSINENLTFLSYTDVMADEEMADKEMADEIMVPIKNQIPPVIAQVKPPGDMAPPAPNTKMTKKSPEDSYMAPPAPNTNAPTLYVSGGKRKKKTRRRKHKNRKNKLNKKNKRTRRRKHRR